MRLYLAMQGIGSGVDVPLWYCNTVLDTFATRLPSVSCGPRTSDQRAASRNPLAFSNLRLPPAGVAYANRTNMPCASPELCPSISYCSIPTTLQYCTDFKKKSYVSAIKTLQSSDDNINPIGHRCCTTQDVYPPHRSFLPHFCQGPTPLRLLIHCDDDASNKVTVALLSRSPPQNWICVPFPPAITYSIRSTRRVYSAIDFGRPQNSC